MYILLIYIMYNIHCIYYLYGKYVMCQVTVRGIGTVAENQLGHRSVRAIFMHNLFRIIMKNTVVERSIYCYKYDSLSDKHN